jgi:hypothetical protein
MNKQFIFLLIALIFGPISSTTSWSQNLVNDLSSPVSQSSAYAELFTEYIKIIGNSRRIFIMTNENGRLLKGDFFSIVVNDKLTARALVAKNNESLIGVKILRIDSLANWARIRKGLAVQILKGDDSSFKSNQNAPKNVQEEIPSIKGEEDLFSSSNVLLEDVELNDNRKRAIKTDNLVAVGVGYFSAASATEDSEANFQMWNAQWAYQIADDIWLEGLFGRSLMTDYPGPLIETLVTNFTVRFKYTFKAPLYSYIMPYIGYQMFNVSSPEAGTDFVGRALTAEERANELGLTRDLAKNQFIFGVTILKRLVPGWFIRADIGTDILSAGFSIEF